MLAIRALALAVDARDRYTRDHSRRVSAYAASIGARIGLGAQQIEALKVAGELHDVGKIALPDSILLKPAALTPSEYELMKAHSAAGERIVNGIGCNAIATWIRHHHERWDGGGYPDGLRGDEIPLASRILAAADSLDAMSTDRSYSRALGTGDVIPELRRSAGSQLDPRVTESLILLLRREVVTLPVKRRQTSTAPAVTSQTQPSRFAYTSRRRLPAGARIHPAFASTTVPDPLQT